MSSFREALIAKEKVNFVIYKTNCTTIEHNGERWEDFTVEVKLCMHYRAGRRA